MIVILSDANEKDLELVKRILGDTSVAELKIGTGTKDESIGEQQGLTTPMLQEALIKKGYRCKTPDVAKKIALKYGLKMDKQGSRNVFENALHKIPNLLPVLLLFMSIACNGLLL